MKEKIFVTGGSGLLGQSLVRLLVQKGCDVIALARSERSQNILQSLGTSVIHGDLLDYDAVKRGAMGCDVVFHLGGAPSFRFIDRVEVMRVHTEGTRNIIRVIEECNISKFIFCSSVGALTFIREGPQEGAAKIASVYEHAKFIAHCEVEAFAKKRKGVTMILPAYVMGPGGKDIFGAYMKAFCQGRLPFVVHLEQPLSYVHVDDVAEAMWLSWMRGRDGGQYILASEDCTPMQLLDLMEKYSRHKRPRLIISPRMAAPLLVIDELFATFRGRHPYMTVELLKILTARPWVFSSELAKKELGWNPRGLDQMVQETIASFN